MNLCMDNQIIEEASNHFIYFDYHIFSSFVIEIVEHFAPESFFHDFLAKDRTMINEGKNTH